MKVTSTVKGLAEMDALLRQLPGATSRRVMTNALRAGGRVIVAEAKRQVPVATGDLRKSLNVRTTQVRDRNRKEVGVGVRGKESRLAHLVEFGTSAHEITAKPGKKLAFQADGKLVVVSKVAHPGAKARPFIRPAADTRVTEVIQKVGDNLGQGIEREALKLKARR